MSARSFTKWVGGKGALLEQILPHLPHTFGHYYEPFVGGGALFWTLQPARATLSDANADLVATYVAVRDEVEAVIEALQPLRYAREEFEDIRRRFNACRQGLQQASLFGAPAPVSAATRAAWFLYLLRCGFNGLWRVNGDGEYNVTFGAYVNPTICDAVNLRACSAALAEVEILCADFTTVALRAAPGDLVYLDSPYVPVSATANFTTYTADGFGPRDFARLAATYRTLVERGVHVVASNSATEAAMSLYPGARFVQVMRSGGINCKAEKRGAVGEILAVRLAGGAT